MQQRWLGALVLLTVTTTACSSTEARDGSVAPDQQDITSSRPDVEAPGTDEAAALRALILGIDAPVVPAAQALTATADGTASENRDDQLFSCTYERRQGVELYDTLVSFDPNADVLWPGSLVQTKNLAQGILEPIGLPRAQGAITFGSALGNDAGSVSRDVQPSQASTQDAINQVLGSNALHFPTKVSYRAEEAHSLTEAAAKVGLAASWLQGSVGASFQGSWTDAKTTMIVSFTQSYYSVSFAAPPTPEAVFASGTRAQDAALYMGQGNAPGYVASVTYGRMLLVKIESTASASELKAALDVAFNAGVADGSVEAGFDHKKILRDANVTVFALGGNAELATEVMTNAEQRADKIAAYLADGASFSTKTPGVPVSYTVRQLANNQLVRVASTLDYRVPSCAAAKSRFAISLNSLHVVDNGAYWSNPDLEVKIYARAVDADSASTAACTVADSTGCGALLLDQTFSSVGDDDRRAFTQSQEHRLDALAKDGERVELVFAVKSGSKSFLAVDRHHFTVSGNQGTWSDLGARTVGSAADGLTVNLDYGFEPIAD